MKEMTQREKELARQVVRLDEEKELLKKRLEKCRKMYIDQVYENERLSDYISELEALRDLERGRRS